jgi:hypothetical protein
VPTPEFVLRLRERIGHDPLWLVGTTAVVVDGERLLLVRRPDSGDWTSLDDGDCHRHLARCRG